jgi:shikimate kinase
MPEPITPSARTTGPLCVLVGAPGAGKTKVGRLLAGELGVSIRDTDHDVEAVAGKPVAEIFVADGEPAFRALEAAAVARAVAEHRGVLALGGGAVLDPGTRDLLAGQPVVWLRVSVPVAAARTGMSSTPRPLLMGNLRGTLRKLLAARDPVYAQVARMVLDADADDLPGKVAAIRKWLSEGAPQVSPPSDPQPGSPEVTGA